MTTKRITGKKLRNEYFIETRVKGYIYKDEQTKIESVTFTLQITRGQDMSLQGEDVLQLTYAQGLPVDVWVSDEANEHDITALLVHFGRKTSVEWLTEARTLATEWANGQSYEHADVDHRGLLIHGQDLQEIDA